MSAFGGKADISSDNPYYDANRGVSQSKTGLWHTSPYIEDDIAQYLATLAELMCQSDVAQRQAPSHRVD
jgi:hypothetical protein